MKIVADENIPLADVFFGGLGEVVSVPGRTLDAAQVADADVLLVRSVTQVNRELLVNSNVRFVASATSGIDHVDTDWLQKQGIGFAHAPGCNADSVVEYVLSAINILSEQLGFVLKDQVVGIIGKGHVGGRLLGRLEASGVRCLVHDPFAPAEKAEQRVELDELLKKADIISLHTPLTNGGDHPTFHLLDEQRIGLIRPGSVLINSSRGPVVDNLALLARLQQRNITAVLDVWEQEPDISLDLLDHVAIGTPHIAGYSLEAKIRGTGMIYQALCRYFGLPARVRINNVMPIPVLRSLTFSSDVQAEEAITTALRAVYDVRRDDVRLRLALRQREEAVPMVFDRLRKNYLERREFQSLKVRLRNTTPDVQILLEGQGFRVISE
ncbi:4-phosphoerythronate dehydrogenase PdxB [Kistimonas asteriae]|uniref:4-phosphoerythronate dehydrogenase PdxB n=1 Tax=Kistimonas asteriae TaxID=517724 RepID=UPI001BAE2E91|nr:4-phosphoerythronate dehydrogenase PdxB [Kistimonas asteriae]